MAKKGKARNMSPKKEREERQVTQKGKDRKDTDPRKDKMGNVG